MNETFGEVSFKGEYEYSTSLVNDVILHNCTYNNDTVFNRTCEGDGKSAANWIDVSDTMPCKIQDEVTAELAELSQVWWRMKNQFKSELVSYDSYMYVCVL